MSVPKWLDLPPVWLVIFMGFAWFMASVWAPLGDWLRLPGLLLIGASVGLAIWSAIAFRRAGTTIVPHQEPSALVTAGPYQYSRNPIYLADLGILAGWCLSLGTVAGLVLLAPFWMVLEQRFIRPEEARLTAALGEPYKAYCRAVRRWV
ncbi:MAG: isoprenylcysteine carboxylmethyltransferase family protein [Pseudomonadota bacterium]